MASYFDQFGINTPTQRSLDLQLGNGEITPEQYAQAFQNLKSPQVNERAVSLAMMGQPISGYSGAPMGMGAGAQQPAAPQLGGQLPSWFKGTGGAGGVGSAGGTGGFQPIKTGYNINPNILGLLQQRLDNFSGLLGR